MTVGRLFAVIGDPVAHSRSPAMHTAAFEAMGLPHRYAALRVVPTELPAAIAGVRAMAFGGINVTVPHKQAVMAHLDDVDEIATRVAAVNTITRTADGRLVGTNTDAPGFADALAELGPPPRRAVVLGGGGASRAIVAALLDAGAEVSWVSRRPRAVVPLGGASLVSWFDLDPVVEGADLVVNATPVGMAGGPPEFPRPIPLAVLAPDARVVDAVVGPAAGGLLDQAAAAGHRVQDGRVMLLWQGVRALRVWLDREIPDAAIAAMRAAI